MQYHNFDSYFMQINSALYQCTKYHDRNHHQTQTQVKSLPMCVNKQKSLQTRYEPSAAMIACFSWTLKIVIDIKNILVEFT